MAPRTTTTTKRVTKPKVVDIDAQLADELDETDEDEPAFKTVRLLGMDLKIRCDVNSYILNQALDDDPGALVDLLRSIIVNDDQVEEKGRITQSSWVRFDEAMKNAKHMGTAKLSKIFVRLVEAASERPTN